MPVEFVPVDQAAILSEIITDFETITGRTLLPSQPEYLFCSALAYRIVLERQRQNATGNSQLLEFSTAPVLDYLVALLGITRLPAQYAETTLQFTLVAGHGDVVIPQNTRVRSTDGIVTFVTKADMEVESEINVVNVDAICQVAGTIGNGYAIGTISEIQDVQAYLSTCSNVDITVGGSDSETDSQLRERAFQAPSAFSVAGSRNAYKFWARSASPLITDIAVITRSEDETIPEGQVNIYPLLSTGELANQPLLDSISDIVSAETVRPLTDTVVVANPTKVNYTIQVDIVKLTGTSSADITTAVNALLFAYGNTKAAKLGQDVVNSEIESLCRVANVYDLTVTIAGDKVLTGDNLVIDADEFAFLTDYEINITGTNNG